MKKGQITVFLSLVLTVLISMVLTVVEGARSTAMQLVADCAADMAIQSVFAEYHRELYNQYDILFIDCAYGMQTGSFHNTEAHMCDYLMYNLQPRKGIDRIGYSDWFDLSLSQLQITEAELASDYFGFAVKEQAVSYMRDKIGLEAIEDIADLIEATETYKLNERDIGSELESYRAEISEKSGGKTLADTIWKETKLYKEFDKPMAAIELEIMQFMFQNDKELSTQMIDLRNYTSFRDDNNGVGYPPTFEAEDVLDGIWFGEYIMEKCGNYCSNTDKMHLKYQTEYILTGGFADDMNLRMVVVAILYLRCAANMLTISSDQEKVQEAGVLGTVLSSLLCIPEAEKAVTQCILCLWAIGESVCDLKEITTGGRVPLVKGKDDWKLSLSGLAGNITEIGADEDAIKGDLPAGDVLSKGLSYEDYLRIFLGMIPLPLKVSRCMDIMEMDIRKTEGNQFFRLDQCMDAISVRIMIQSSYEQCFLLERKYGYW